MASPSIRSYCTSKTTSAGTSHTVSMPATITAGDTLIVLIGGGSASAGWSWPAGWTEIADYAFGSPSCAAAWRKADGTEDGGTITVTNANSCKAVHFAYAIQDAYDPTVVPPEGLAYFGVDPAALTPMRGAQDYLALTACYGSAGTGVTVYACTDYPTGYADGQQADATGTSGTNGDVAAGCASDQLTGASVDPGTFTFAGANPTYRHLVVAVYPAILDATLPYPVGTAGKDQTTSNTTSQKVTIPAGADAGETLLAVIATDGTGTHTWPAGWNEILDLNDAAAVSMSVAWKKAVGDEGGTQITVTSSASEQSSSICWRIANAKDPTVSAPLCTAGATGASTGPNPDSLDAGVSDSFLWFALMASDANKTVTGYPADYPLANSYHYYSGGTGGATVGTAARMLANQTADPAAFTISGSDQWCACTVAIKPADFSDSQTAVLDPAVRTRTGQDVTLTLTLTVPLDPAQRIRSGQNIQAATGPISIILDPAVRARSGADITALTQLVIPLDPAVRARTAPDVTVLTGPVSMLLDAARRTRTAADTTALSSLTVLLDPATRTRTAADLTVIPGAVTVLLDAAARTRSGQNITPTFGPAVILLDPAARSRSGQTITAVPGELLILLDPAARTRAGQDLTGSGGPAVILLDPAIRVRSVGNLIILPGGITVPLDPAARTRAGQDLTADVGELLILLDPAQRNRLAQQITATAGWSIIPLDPAVRARAAASVFAYRRSRSEEGGPSGGSTAGSHRSEQADPQMAAVGDAGALLLVGDHGLHSTIGEEGNP